MTCIDINQQTGLVEGKVLEAAEDAFTVRVGEHAATARRAIGCLLQPCSDDTVLLYQRPDDTYYILNVLERSSPAVNEIFLGQDGAIICRGSLKVNGGKEFELVSEKIGSHSAEQVINTHSLEVNAQKAQASLGTLGVVAQKVDAVVRFMLQKLGRSYKTVESTDETHAANIRLKSEDVFQVESNYTIMVSDEVTRVDGKQIQMG